MLTPDRLHRPYEDSGMTDDVIVTYGDLIKETPEAEQAIRDYYERRRREKLRAQLLTAVYNPRGTDSLE